MSTISELWLCEDDEIWRFALKTYWLFIKSQNRKLEVELESLGSERIRELDAEGWYKFLRDKYFRWKFTAANRYATTTRLLDEFYAVRPTELFDIKERLFNFDRESIEEGLKTAMDIAGLGAAGASGLLALLFPQKFGTVDQFVVSALLQVEVLGLATTRPHMNPEQLKLDDAAWLIGIMRCKAADNNRRFSTNFWTPRKMDMILWAYGHETE